MAKVTTFMACKNRAFEELMLSNPVGILWIVIHGVIKRGIKKGYGSHPKDVRAIIHRIVGS
jgi:hypothetical protein